MAQTEPVQPEKEDEEIPEIPGLPGEQRKHADRLAFEAYFGQIDIDTIEDESADIMRYVRTKIEDLKRSGVNYDAEMDAIMGKLEFLEGNILEQQYRQMLKTLEFYEISTKGVPSAGSIRKGLEKNNMDVLKKALNFQKPTLLLIPPTSRKSKVEAINKHKVKGQRYDTYTYRMEDDNLWNGGKPEEDEEDKQWRVEIVEGVQYVKQDQKIYDGKRTSYEVSHLWIKKYEDLGLEVMNDADAYLTLMMKGLAEGKPVDQKCCTVLNGKNLTKSSGVARGDWAGDWVNLDFDNPAFFNDFFYLRLRGSVGVDVPEAA